MSARTMCKIGDLCDQIRGVTYAKSDAVSASKPGYKPVLRANNITDRGLQYHDLVYVPAGRISSRQHVKANDVVVAASSGSLDVVGKAARAVADFDGGFGAFCKVLRPNEKVDAGYFAHFFQTQSYRQKVSSLAAGANINNLRNEHLDDLEIILPPLGEQRRIAAILDKADALRAKRREAIAKLDQLLQSVFIDMFGDPATNRKGWPEFRLGEIAGFYAGNSLPVGVEYSGQRDGYLALKVSDLNSAGNEEFVNVAALWVDGERRGAIKCPAGAVLFPKRGGAIGTNKKRILSRSAYLDPNLMGVLASEEHMHPAFLLHWFKQIDLSDIASGSSVPQLNKRDLDPLVVSLPPKKNQEIFAAVAECIRRRKLMLEESAAALHGLFTSLQHRAFAGAL